MRRATLLLALMAGCSAAATKTPPEAAIVDLSAAPDAGSVEPQTGALDASTPDAHTADTDAPEAPAEVPGLASLTPREIKLATRIHFKTDQPVILDESLPLLDAIATLLLSHPKVTIEIQCHSDNRGAEAHNLELTRARAHTIRSYLVAKGVAEERMKATGYGSSRPITDIPSHLLRRCEFARTDVQ